MGVLYGTFMTSPSLYKGHAPAWGGLGFYPKTTKQVPNYTPGYCNTEFENHWPKIIGGFFYICGLDQVGSHKSQEVFCGSTTT